MSLIRTSQADARQKIAKRKQKNVCVSNVENGRLPTPRWWWRCSRRANELNALQCHRRIGGDKQENSTYTQFDVLQTQTRTTQRTMLSTNQPTSATSNGKTVSAAGKLTFYFCVVVLLSSIFVVSFVLGALRVRLVLVALLTLFLSMISLRKFAPSAVFLFLVPSFLVWIFLFIICSGCWVSLFLSLSMWVCVVYTFNHIHFVQTKSVGELSCFMFLYDYTNAVVIVTAAVDFSFFLNWCRRCRRKTSKWMGARASRRCALICD